MMAMMSPPKAAVPIWNIKVFPTEAITVSDPTLALFLAKYHEDTDMAIAICCRQSGSGWGAINGGKWHDELRQGWDKEKSVLFLAVVTCDNTSFSSFLLQRQQRTTTNFYL